jgi:hypothetical protein
MLKIEMFILRRWIGRAGPVDALAASCDKTRLSSEIRTRFQPANRGRCRDREAAVETAPRSALQRLPSESAAGLPAVARRGR